MDLLTLIFQLIALLLFLYGLYLLITRAIDALNYRTSAKRDEIKQMRELGDTLYMLTQTLQETGTANQQIFAEVIASLHENTAQMKDRTRESIRRNKRTELTKAEQESKTPITDEQIEELVSKTIGTITNALTIEKPEEEVLIIGG